MKAKQKPHESRGWVTIQKAAELLATSSQNLRQSHIPDLAPEHIRSDRRPAEVYFPGLHETIARKRVADAIRSRPTIADDPLLNEGDSPGLERYRMAKAKLAELDLEARKEQLIDREKARDIFGRWATLIRRAGERLSKRWGNEAAAMLNETLDECGAIVAELKGREGGDAGITKS